MDTRKTFIDKCFKDKSGKVVLGQRWNLPIAVWFIAIVIALPFHGIFDQGLRWVGGIAIVIWALLELLQGINYFRRVLGLMTLIVIAFALLSGNTYLHFLL